MVLNELFHTFEGEFSPTGEIPQRPKPISFDRIEVPLARDPLLEFFASQLMQGGKRARAEKSTSEILLHINALTKAPPLPILRQAVDLAAPAVRIVRHKMASKIIAKPFALNERQRTKKAIGWILEESNKRVGYTRGERIARECILILQGKSKVLESKEAEHKAAMVNRWVTSEIILRTQLLTASFTEETCLGCGRWWILYLYYILRCSMSFNFPIGDK